MNQAGMTSELTTHRKEEYLRIWKKGPLQKQTSIESGFPRDSSSFSCRWSVWEQCRAPRRRPQRRRGGRAVRARREPRLGSSGARNRCRLLLRTSSKFARRSSDDPPPLYCQSEHFVETCSFTKPYIDRWFQWMVLLPNWPEWSLSKQSESHRLGRISWFVDINRLSLVCQFVPRLQVVAMALRQKGKAGETRMRCHQEPDFRKDLWVLRHTRGSKAPRTNHISRR